jgi:hypothetical protein
MGGYKEVQSEKSKDKENSCSKERLEERLEIEGINFRNNLYLKNKLSSKMN